MFGAKHFTQEYQHVRSSYWSWIWKMTIRDHWSKSAKFFSFRHRCINGRKKNVALFESLWERFVMLIPPKFARMRAIITGRYSASEPDGKVIIPTILSQSYPKHLASLRRTLLQAVYMTLEIDLDTFAVSWCESSSWFIRFSLTAAASKYAFALVREYRWLHDKRDENDLRCQKFTSWVIVEEVQEPLRRTPGLGKVLLKYLFIISVLRVSLSSPPCDRRISMGKWKGEVEGIILIFFSMDGELRNCVSIDEAKLMPIAQPTKTISSSRKVASF